MNPTLQDSPSLQLIDFGKAVDLELELGDDAAVANDDNDDSAAAAANGETDNDDPSATPRKSGGAKRRPAPTALVFENDNGAPEKEDSRKQVVSVIDDILGRICAQKNPDEPTASATKEEGMPDTNGELGSGDATENGDGAEPH